MAGSTGEFLAQARLDHFNFARRRFAFALPANALALPPVGNPKTGVFIAHHLGLWSFLRITSYRILNKDPTIQKKQPEET